MAPPPPTSATSNPEWCLCLSGGGFRATLFHLGVVRRLNELGVLSRLSTITSVSGGSILNGILATRWAGLTFDATGTSFTNLDALATDVRRFCSIDIRTRLLLGTRLNLLNAGAVLRDWFSVSADFLADEYTPLFQGTTLASVPSPRAGVPRFVFCSTNVFTGACWHFHGGPGGRMGDFYTGYCDASHVPVRVAVAASSAFPIGFSALRLRMPAASEVSRIDPWGTPRPLSEKRGAAWTPSRMLLTDGGVYDNLGVEPVWNRAKALIVSDAGKPFETVTTSRQAAIPRLKRVSAISEEQVAAVRKRWLVEGLVAGRRAGAVWTLSTRLSDFPITDAQGYGDEASRLIHRVRTDLDAFTEGEIACLENHGYSLADAAMRSRAPSLCANLAAPFHWPHPTWACDAAAKMALASSHKHHVCRSVGRYFREALWG